MKAMKSGRKRKIATITGLVFCLVLCIAVASAAALSSSGGGEWGYQRELVIHEQSGDTLSNYQVLVELSGSNFPANAQSDGDDIRFADSSGTELSYWIKAFDSSAKEAKIWVKVPSIPASGETTVTMWYGNPSASEVSDGDATFEFFDDFDYWDSSKWGTKPSEASVNNGILTLDAGLHEIHSISSFGLGTEGIARSHLTGVSGGGMLVGFLGPYPQRDNAALISGSGAAVYIQKGAMKDGVRTWPRLIDYTTDWKVWKVTRVSTSRIDYQYDSNVESITDSSVIPIIDLPLVLQSSKEHPVEYDWMLISKYSSFEPTLSIGAEQPTPEAPSLILSKSVSPSTIKESETATITVKVGNRGSADATNIVVTDSIPAAFSLVSGSLTQSYDTLKPTEYRTYQYTAEATKTGSFVTDVATATYEDDEGNSYSSVSNSVTITVEPETTPTPSTPTPTSTPTPSTPTPSTPTPSTPTPTSEPTEEPELSISQSSLKEEPEVGEDILVTVAILNKGKGTAQNIRLAENIPSSIAVNYVEGGEKAGSLVYWNGELDSGEAHSITHTLRILEEKNRIIPVTVTYEDASGTEHQQSAEIYLTAELPAQPSLTPTPAFELPHLSWPYLIILVAVVLGGLAIIVAVRGKGRDGGAEVTIEEKRE